MAQGEFTKEEAKHVEETVVEIMEAMPKRKAADFVGHFNDIFLFISAAKGAAPSEPKKQKKGA